MQQRMCVQHPSKKATAYVHESDFLAQHVLDKMRSDSDIQDQILENDVNRIRVETIHNTCLPTA